MEKRCIDCEYCKLIDKTFCEWECSCKASPEYSKEVEMDDSCGCFSVRKDLELKGTIQRSDLVLRIRDLGAANEKAALAGTVNDDYHDGFLDALSELIREVYK